jgi:hypothetical protein
MDNRSPTGGPTCGCANCKTTRTARQTKPHTAVFRKRKPTAHQPLDGNGRRVGKPSRIALANRLKKAKAVE